MNKTLVNQVLDLNNRECEALNKGLTALHEYDEYVKYKNTKELWVPTQTHNVTKHRRTIKRFRAYASVKGENIYLGETTSVKKARELQKQHMLNLH